MNKIQKTLLNVLLICVVCLSSVLMINSKAFAAVAGMVEVVSIDYDEATMLIDPHGNTKVYYSDEKENVWNEVEGRKLSNGYYMLDISWVSNAKDYELHLKGDDNDTVVEVILPKQNKAFTAKFDKLGGNLIFGNEGGAKTFEWRKSTSYEWHQGVSVSQVGESGQQFLQEIEELRVKGAKIYVRIPQTVGTSATNVGKRSSREVLVTITKRSNAPTVSISNTKFTIATKTTQEYMIYSIDGRLTGNTKWQDAKKTMNVSEVASEALLSYTSAPKDVVLAIRTKETAKAPYSKTLYLTIPAQKSAPKDYSVSYSDSQYFLYFNNASKNNVYQYAVVKEGAYFSESTAAWKSITSPKSVTLSKKSVPAGSTVYIRLKGNNQTSTVPFSFPTAYTTQTVKYSAK